MREYLPSRKVIAAALLAAVATVYLVSVGQASLEAVTGAWAPVAAAYAIPGKG